MTLLCVALVALVPSSSGSSWRPVLNELRGLDARWVLVLTVAWWAGLCSHSFVLTASLPGLTSRRAIGLNLAGIPDNFAAWMGAVADDGFDID